MKAIFQYTGDYDSGLKVSGITLQSETEEEMSRLLAIDKTELFSLFRISGCGYGPTQASLTLYTVGNEFNSNVTANLQTDVRILYNIIKQNVKCHEDCSVNGHHQDCPLLHADSIGRRKYNSD